jgi:hypothetical protein
MIMEPIFGSLVVSVTQDHVQSALPNAPVVPDPPPHEPRIRPAIAAFLRSSAQRRARLADRLDPCPGRAEPLAN